MVTGGCGFIGRHLVQALVEQDQPVRVLDLNPGPETARGKVDVWRGSVLDKDLLFNAMQGVTVVYHLAAIPHLWSLNPSDFHRVNVEGTQSVLEVAQHAGLSKLIYTSSETVLRGWRDQSIEAISEASPQPEPDEMLGPYSRSKLLAERKVMEAVKQGLPAVIVYPSIPIGAGDVNLTPPTRMIRDFLDGKTLAYLECTLNLIPVKAVAEGHIAARKYGSAGSRYILGQDNLKMSELLRLMEKKLGKKMPRRRVPYTVALATAKTMEFVARYTRKIPQASVEGVRLAGANMKFDCSKARDELQLPHYSLSQALWDTAEWLKETGYIK